MAAEIGIKSARNFPQTSGGILDSDTSDSPMPMKLTPAGARDHSVCRVVWLYDSGVGVLMVSSGAVTGNGAFSQRIGAWK